MTAVETKKDVQNWSTWKAAMPKDWLAPAREAAMARFETLGFPTIRHEEWKYTNTAPIAGQTFVAPATNATVAKKDIDKYLFAEQPGALAVFVNGRFNETLSDLSALPAGITVMSLASALESKRELLEPHLTKYADYREHAFCALNTALFTDGAVIHVAEGTLVDRPVHVLYLTTQNDAPTASFPRNIYLAEANSSMRLVETYGGPNGAVYFNNAVTEFVARDNAIIDHYQVERESTDAFQISTRQVFQTRDSNVSSHTLAFGGRLVRNDINTLLDGENANCMFNGLSVLRGNQHVDNHLRVDHAQPHCNSWEFFKGIYDDTSRGAFCGRIIVREDAQKTDAKQSNMSLLLSRDAMIDTKPQLEILADDVKCTHGATIGQLDEEAIFYLRSRGVSVEAARSLLVYAFAGESIGQVRIPALRDKLQDLLSERLHYGESLTFGRPFEYSDDFADLVRAADRRRET